MENPEKQNVDIFSRLNNAVAAFRKTKNDAGVDPNAFLRYGKNRMHSTWSTPEITDQDFYTGYGFAVINKRANRSVVLGKKFLTTDANETLIKKANESKTDVTHPYLDLIRNSTDFAERDFWYNISTYLDLEGIYYLMAVRTVTVSGKVGNIQKFSLLNPYWMRQVVNRDGDLGGYVESNPYKGVREIPKEMIIPIQLLNPFDPTKPYSLADAARDSQFTLKQANDFARNSIDGNLNAPGILSSAIELPDDQFDNFVARVKNHDKGEPLFGNGSGTVSWVDMQTDLDKAALDKINSINRDVLLAVSGLSKTGVGVEESGTGREVSRTQKDDFTENAVMPQIENIIDALNLDYRKYYNDQWSKNGYAICLDNPLETAHEAEKADTDIRDSQFALFQTLVNKGYDSDLAAKYAKGLIDITDLGEPTNPPENVIPPTEPIPPIDPTAPADPLPVDTPTAPKNQYRKIRNQLAARDLPDLYDGMNIDMSKLGCIMMNTEKIPVTEFVPDPEEDIIDDGDHSGVAGETEPHVTLLFGLLENGNTWKNKVDQVLEGWKCGSVTISSVSSFDLGDQYAIVGLINKSPELIDGHERLTLLPHINTFSEYVPHITLAYVKHDEDVMNKWVRALNGRYSGAKVATKDINYGDLPEDMMEESSAKKFEMYEGYPIPVLQYLGEEADQVTPLSEKGSFVFSTENVLKQKTVHIHHITADQDALLAVVDENTFIKLGEFKQNADKVTIVAKLNKRYTNQPVALKKKISFDHDHAHLNEIIKNAVFDKQTQIEASTNDLKSSAQAAEDKLYEWYLAEINAGNTNPHADNLTSFINSLTLPFAVYFTVLFPIYASYRVSQTAKDLGMDVPVIQMTEEVKRTINDFALREAQSHINTLNMDIQNALALIRTQTSDPAEIKRLFTEAYKSIRDRRSVAIANNAASRIFNMSQYEADLQFLNKTGLIQSAYKVLYSLTGDPCPFCQTIIDETNADPIPFTQNFASVGDSIEGDGKTFNISYEDIIAGNVHPNCRCVYHLIIKNDVAQSSHTGGTITVDDSKLALV